MPLTDALCPEALRPQILIRAAKRLVIKVGSALVNDAAADAPAHVWLAALAEDVAALHGAGAEVLIVSSGAVALGRTPLGLGRRKLRLSEKQAAAAAGQSRLMRAWDQAFAAQGRPVAQVLLTREDTESRARWLNARDTLNALFACGAVPIVNENDTVATDEIRYGDNDRLAARVAQLVRADALLLLSDVDGLYDADPRKNPAARHIAYVETLDDEVEALAGGANLDDGVGTGGMATKLAAAKIAGSAGCATVIAEGRKPHPIEALLAGARATVVAPLATPLAAYKQWIAGSVAPAGALEVDAGAEAALKRGKSLLPSGIVGVSGRFSAGDTVKILGPGGREIARGLSAYDVTEINRLMGRPSAAIAEILGYAAGDEIVHRDNLVWTGS